MSFNNELYDIILLCDYKGVIMKVLRSNFKPEGFPKMGQSLIKLSLQEEQSKVLELFYTLLTHKKVVEWEHIFTLNKQMYPMTICAEVFDSKHMLVGLMTNPKIFRMYDEIMALNNKYVNELRTVVKENAVLTQCTREAIEGGNALGDSSMISEKQKLVDNENYYYKQLLWAMANNLACIQPQCTASNAFVEVGSLEMHGEIIETINYGIMVNQLLMEQKQIGYHITHQKVLYETNISKSQLLGAFCGFLTSIIQWAIPKQNVEIALQIMDRSFLLEIAFEPMAIKQNPWKQEMFAMFRALVDQNEGMVWDSVEHNKVKLYIVIQSITSHSKAQFE